MGLAASRSVELHLGLLHGWQGTKNLGHLSLLFQVYLQVYLQGVGVEVEQPGLTGAYVGCHI